MRQSPSNRETSPSPLTDPTDFWTMVGRFVAAQVINVLLVSAIMARSWLSVALFAVVSLILHRVVIRQYRKLRQERLDAIQERLETQVPSNQEP